MSLVMIRCPDTGRAVSTEIEIELAEFRKLPAVAGRMQCPACGRNHVWTISSAWLAGGPRLARPDVASATAAA